MHNVFIRVINFVRRILGIKDKHLEYGWIPDTADSRDFAFTGTLKALPPKVDLRPLDSPIYDQGSLGSCTSNAVGAMFQFVNRKMNGVDFNPSRLFIYYNVRLMRNRVNFDSGAAIRDGMKVIKNNGVCYEALWPYVIADFKLKPSAAAYAEALKHQSIKYMRIPRSLTKMKQCLAEGYPFVFGFTIYESFRTEPVNRDGLMPVPAKTEKALGGHAVMAVGYNDEKRCFIIRNSWGTWWGDEGYFYMPYEIITSGRLMSSDFWTLRTVEL